MKQALIGANYGLLDSSNLNPLPVSEISMSFLGLTLLYAVVYVLSLYS